MSSTPVNRPCADADLAFLRSIDKSLEDKPLTGVTITASGRKAFAAYLDALGGLIGGRG